MDGQSTVVPTGGCSLPLFHLSSCSSARYSCGHGLVSPGLPWSLEKSFGSFVRNRTSERYCSGGGSARAGQRRLRKESHKLVITGGVTCSYRKSSDSTKRREEFSLDSERASERLLAGADVRRGVVDAYTNRDDNRERYRGQREGHAGGVRLHKNDRSRSGRILPDEHSLQGSEKHLGKASQGATGSRPSDGRDVQCIEEGGEEITEGNITGRIKRPGDQITDLAGDSSRLIARQPILNIPKSELMKIEELRFSGDLREGDSGPQVLNLQRALFWLGHLPGLSLTGYFGPETTRALQEFHTVHGVPSSGVWGFHSQQALRKHLQPESYRLDTVEKLGTKGSSKSSSRLSEIWPLAKSISGKMVHSGHHARRAVQLWYSKTLPGSTDMTDFMASVSSAPQLSSVSGRVGLFLIGIVVLSSIAKVWIALFGRPQGQPVRRRVMSWRNDVNLRESTRKTLRTQSGRPQGPLKISENDGFVRRPRNRSLPTSKEQQENNHNLLDRLVLFDGQVLRGDGPSNAKSLPSISSGLDVLAQNSSDDPSRSSVWNKVSHMSPAELPHHSGVDVEQEKTVYGFDRYVKLEADPPRKYQLFSQIETSSRLSGRDPSRPARDTPYDSPNPSWPAWMGNFFSNIFPDKERYSSQKLAFRRTVRRGNSPVRTKFSEKVSSEGKSSLRLNRVDRVPVDENDLGKWHEDDESDLRRQVEEMHRTVQAANQTRMSAMRALAEERMRSLELENKISRQKEAAASLEEEVRVLKESHDALLASLRKKYSSSAAARAAAALLYQNWDSSDSNARV
ncbi:hypothetical protein MPTK1_1g16870 [Marchantia polymorpha subsp. ruderalis]|nr:hypothetical protein MARPO_0001s0027 [Marchantia polymorpha]BBM98874.1 hypothetical protein Mp_1g16870 [Marchantia polymorpha subsp. ruderalis]|eukprot:PTQ49950.1 hypothetical protein MARPO_0001s0027 [Marchantia polymorpha]